PAPASQWWASGSFAHWLRRQAAIPPPRAWAKALDPPEKTGWPTAAAPWWWPRTGIIDEGVTMASKSSALRKADTPERDDFAAMLDESLGQSTRGFEGTVAKGTVVNIVGDFAIVDVGLKSEGRIPLKEFALPGQASELKIGDAVEVFVDRMENREGEAMLSRERARRE